MDARLDPWELLGLGVGDAHVIRNAGGVVTDDVIRSLVISQRLLGTEEIMLIRHTGCGMLTFRDDELEAQIAAEVGTSPPFALKAFANLEDDLRESISRIAASPFLVTKDVRGFVYDMGTGLLTEVPHALHRE
jgi:carbonic anhydrase